MFISESPGAFKRAEQFVRTLRLNKRNENAPAKYGRHVYIYIHVPRRNVVEMSTDDVFFIPFKGESIGKFSVLRVRTAFVEYPCSATAVGTSATPAVIYRVLFFIETRSDVFPRRR